MQPVVRAQSAPQLEHTPNSFNDYQRQSSMTCEIRPVEACLPGTSPPRFTKLAAPDPQQCWQNGVPAGGVLCQRWRIVNPVRGTAVAPSPLPPGELLPGTHYSRLPGERVTQSRQPLTRNAWSMASWKRTTPATRILKVSLEGSVRGLLFCVWFSPMTLWGPVLLRG